MDFSLQDLVQIVLGYGSMGGFAVLVAILIDFLKRIGVVQDDTAQKWSAGLNILVLAFVVSARYWAPELSVEFLDEQAGMVAQVFAVVFSLVLQLMVSPKFHEAGVEAQSVLAFSNSDRF